MSLILSGTDGLSDVDGTAATPAIRGTDANTGIFFGTDIIGFSEGGVEAMRIDASGNVGIGTTNPDVFANSHERSFGVVATGPTSAINVSGSSASRIQFGVGSTRYGIIYQDASNFMQIATTTALPISFVTNNTERMRLDSSGNLGIGTTSPTNKLDVKGVLGVQRSTIAETSTLTMEAGEFDIKASPYGYSIRFFNGTGGSSSEKARIDTSGNLLVGTTGAGGSKFRVNSSGLAGAFYVTAASTTATEAIQAVKFDNNSTTAQVFQKFYINDGAAACGQINANGANTAAFGSTSDSRLKENIVDLPSQLDNIMSLRPVEFDYIESEGGGHQIGFIAQEVQAIYPDLVGERADGMFTLTDLNKNDARLIKAIQEQQALITQLTARITALETA